MPDYPDFEQTCGYGNVTGIGGANCRHSFWPYIEGVSERTYTDAELEAMKPESRPKIEFEGREYNDYQASQMQRSLERSIRRQQRRQGAFAAAGLPEEAQAAAVRLRRLKEQYRRFSKAAGLPEQPERLRAAFIDNASLRTAERRSEMDSFKKAMESSGYILRGFDQYSGDMAALRHMKNAFSRLAQDFPKEAKGLVIGLEKAENEVIGWFDPKKGGIFFSRNIFSDWGAFQKEYEALVKSGHFPAGATAEGCFYHEFGHLIGGLRGINAQKLTRETLLGMGLGYGSPPHISAKSALEKLSKLLSDYATSSAGKSFEEVIAECFSEWYTSSNPRDFCRMFLKKAGVI